LSSKSQHIGNSIQSSYPMLGTAQCLAPRHGSSGSSTMSDDEDGDSFMSERDEDWEPLSAAQGVRPEELPENAFSDVMDWDVKPHRRTKQGLRRLGMVLPTVTRVAMNLVGGTAAAGGYAVGKAGEMIGCRKAIDNPAFHAGLTSWLWANGIVPDVKYEALGGAAAKVAEYYNVPAPRSAKNMSITPVLVSNHVCYLDGAILASICRAPRVVAMSGSRKAPVVGKLMEEMDVIFVDRNRQDSREATLAAIGEHNVRWKPGDRPLLIFPEGGTTNGEGLKDFKKGAFAAGMPVRPMLLVYTSKWDPASTSWTRTQDGDLVEQSSTEWAKQFFGHFVHSIHVRVLAPYFPNSEEKADPGLYAKNVQEYMASNLERVHEELHKRSWKAAAGRSDGALNYQFGDVVRTIGRKLSPLVSRLGG